MCSGIGDKAVLRQKFRCDILRPMVICPGDAALFPLLGLVLIILPLPIDQHGLPAARLIVIPQGRIQQRLRLHTLLFDLL